LGSAPADQRDLQFVRQGADSDCVVGTVRARDTDAARVDEKAKAVGCILRASLGQTVLRMQHELDGALEQPGRFVERETMDLVVTTARTVERGPEPADLD